MFCVFIKLVSFYFKKHFFHNIQIATVLMPGHFYSKHSVRSYIVNSRITLPGSMYALVLGKYALLRIVVAFVY